MQFDYVDAAFYVLVGIVAAISIWFLRRPIGQYRRSFRRNAEYRQNRDDGTYSKDGTRAGASLHTDEHDP